MGDLYEEKVFALFDLIFFLVTFFFSFFLIFLFSLFFMESFRKYIFIFMETL